MLEDVLVSQVIHQRGARPCGGGWFPRMVRGIITLEHYSCTNLIYQARLAVGDADTRLKDEA